MPPTDFIISTVVGDGTAGYAGDDGPAAQARLSSPHALSLSPDGSYYIADTGNHRIRRVRTNGTIHTVVGDGTAGYGGDGGQGPQAQINAPQGVFVDPYGAAYIADTGNHRIRRMDPNGTMTTVAGTGTAGSSGDGGPATAAQLSGPTAVAVGPDLTLYIADSGNHRVRQVDRQGKIHTVSGTGIAGLSGDEGPAPAGKVSSPSGFSFGLDGSLYIADMGNARVRRVGAPRLPTSTGSIAVPSDDGSEVYLFDYAGRHTSTREGLTGAVKYQFNYDFMDMYRLNSIVDGSGNTTTIERDDSGKPTAIVSPDNVRTTLATNTDGYLSSVTNPAGEVVSFTYGTGGLLTGMTDARGQLHSYSYDAQGRLLQDQSPAGGAQALARTGLVEDFTISHSTAAGRTTSYRIEKQPLGGKKWVNTGSDGRTRTWDKGADGTQTLSIPGEETMSRSEGPDPRFGMLSTLPSANTETTPGGLTRTESQSRSVTMMGSWDLFSIMSMTDTKTVNGQTSTETYSGMMRQKTLTSAAGRTRTETLDMQGRLNQVDVPGLSSVQVSYDMRGRVSQVTQGTRTYALAY
jgi:YD repeat-containing protein